MKPYAQRVIFTDHHLKPYRLAVELVDRVSSAWGNELRCHELARAVLRCLSHRLPDHRLIVVDGKCGPVEHSWIQFDDSLILDVYAPGRIPPVQLVDRLIGNYKPGDTRTDINESIINQLVYEMRP